MGPGQLGNVAVAEGPVRLAAMRPPASREPQSAGPMATGMVVEVTPVAGGGRTGRVLVVRRRWPTVASGAVVVAVDRAGDSVVRRRRWLLDCWRGGAWRRLPVRAGAGRGRGSSAFGGAGRAGAGYSHLGGSGGAAVTRQRGRPGGKVPTPPAMAEVAAPIREVLVLRAGRRRARVPEQIGTVARWAAIRSQAARGANWGRPGRGLSLPLGRPAPGPIAGGGIRPGPERPTAHQARSTDRPSGRRGAPTDRVEIAGRAGLVPIAHAEPRIPPQVPANGAASPATAHGCWPNRRMAQPRRRGEMPSSEPRADDGDHADDEEIWVRDEEPGRRR